MDKKSFIMYVESNQRALRRYLIALCHGDTAYADDLAQETYIKAYLAADTFKDEAKFTAWIYKIAYNNFLNSRKRQRYAERLEEVADMPGGSAADFSFSYQSLYAALEQLSERAKNIVLLHYLQGYTTKEIAEIMELNEDNVRQILTRARKDLKLFLSDYK